MSNEIRNLEPRELWQNFANLNAVPRPSKKEERVIEFIKNFGKKLDLPVEEDEVGNVVISKPATKGMEDRKKVVLQAHLDMVHQKNNDTSFNFDEEGIKMFVDGDWVRAEGTTLGADNGLGVASMMAILESDSIQHPHIEALFTIDEETGMTGAKGLKPGFINGDILLNLDTEEDDEIGIGCAGGVDVTAKRTYSEEAIPEDFAAYKLEVKGLLGGHSGMDIIKGLGNANKLMNRVLHYLNLKTDIKISMINGGGLRNAIPRESEAILFVNKDKIDELKQFFEEIESAIRLEYKALEPNLDISLNRTVSEGKSMDGKTQKLFLDAVSAAHNGVYRMSPEIEGLVEASNNIANITLGNGEVKIKCLTRSSVDSTKDEVAFGLKSAFELAGFEVEFSGDYPGWAPDNESAILKTLDEIYQKMFKEQADISACHAGLECGIIGSHYPGLDMISFGPTIRGAHSPDERASISSSQKYWKFLLEVLKSIPKK